jgi:hypothetical protein
MDYYQQQVGKADVSKEDLSQSYIAIYEQLDRETIEAINNYLQIDNYAIGEFILTFVNGLLLCQLYQPNFKSWNAQAEILIEAIFLMGNK